MVRRPRSALAAWLATPRSAPERRRLRAAAYLFVSMALFAAGIILPSCTVHGSSGSLALDILASAVRGEDVTEHSKSILGTVAFLLSSHDLGNRLLGVLLTFCSLVFPSIKYVLMLTILRTRREPRFASRFLPFSTYSLVEVFVVAVLASSPTPFLHFQPGIGLLPFFLSVVTASLCHCTLECITHDESRRLSHDLAISTQP